MSRDRITDTIQYILEILFWSLLILVIVFTVKRYIIQPVVVDGASMETTLDDKDVLLIKKIKPAKGYNRYDIIIFKPYDNDNKDTTEDETSELYIKRIIGLPGETVNISLDGIITITDKNGKSQQLDEKYGSSDMGRGIDWVATDNNKNETITLSEGQYFVLGDNRLVSLDSRSSKIQAVNYDSIIGKYVLRVYPLFKK